MRLLICSFDSPGFLFPLIGLGAELRRRGHRVSVVSGRPASTTLAAAGFARVPRGATDGESFDVRRWHDPLSNAIDYKHVEYAWRTEAPELIVTHHLSLATLVAAERLGCPVAVLGPMTYLYPAATLDGPPRSAETEARLRWRLDEGITIYNRVRELFRLPPVPLTLDDHALLGDLYMLRTVPMLEAGLASLPARVHAVGACEWTPAAAWPDDDAGELREWLARADAPLLYVNNGRSFGGPTFWPALLEALAAMPVRAVASVGRMDAEVGELPPNVLARAHLPQELALPHARAAVAGGHTAVALGAAMHGVPSVLIPHGVDTPDNADRLRDAGCAVTLDIRRATPPALRAAIEQVLTSASMRVAGRAIGRALREADGFAQAADLVETLGRTRLPVRRLDVASLEGALAT